MYLLLKKYEAKIPPKYMEKEGEIRYFRIRFPINIPMRSVAIDVRMDRLGLIEAGL